MKIMSFYVHSILLSSRVFDALSRGEAIHITPQSDTVCMCYSHSVLGIEEVSIAMGHLSSSSSNMHIAATTRLTLLSNSPPSTCMRT